MDSNVTAEGNSRRKREVFFLKPILKCIHMHMYMHACIKCRLKQHLLKLEIAKG